MAATPRRHGLPAFLVLLVLVLSAVTGTALAANSVGCRAGIARSMRRMAGTGMRALDQCHEQLNGGDDVSCATLDNGPWRQQAARTGAFVTAKCPPDDEPVRENYPPCIDCDNITNTIVPGAAALVEANAAVLFGEKPLGGAAARCQDAIGKARFRIAKRTLARAQTCQRKLDRAKGNAEFGPISDECLADAAAGKHAKAMTSVAHACQGLSGTDANTCDPLPDCVVASAKTLGSDLATLTYGNPTTCGDASIELGEECDDGNTVATDACTDMCKLAVCGDGITWEGVEECDDGNDVPTDDCDHCKLPVCGDGVKAGSEECDDGNDVPDDGCTNCLLDPVPCGPGGLRGTVTYSDPLFKGVAGGIMLVEYSSVLSIPGTGAAASVRQRVVNVSTVPNPTFFPQDTDSNGDQVDDTLRINFASIAVWPQGPIAQITFDCASGTLIRESDFQCTFDIASDPASNQICNESASPPVPCDTVLTCRVSDLQSIP
jgi:cysteine-rich repeat protein